LLFDGEIQIPNSNIFGEYLSKRETKLCISRREEWRRTPTMLVTSTRTRKNNKRQRRGRKLP
jgi:hypothetical protein